MEDDAAYHLVQEANDEEVSWSKKQIKGRRISYYLHIIFLACLYAAAVLAGALTVVIVEQTSRSATGSLQMYTPVQEIIQYIPVEQSNSLHYHNPFMANPTTGLPDHTTDDKWQMLYNESMHTSIPPSLADRLPLKTLPVPSDPSKYLIQLEIYHQLHCLNSIRQALWLDGVEHYRFPHFKDFYLPGGRRNYTGHGAKHLDHCLDWIRQSLLCNGDTTPVSWQWDSVAKIPLPQLPETKICKNMHAIDEWTRINAVEEPVDFGFGPDIDL